MKYNRGRYITIIVALLVMCASTQAFAATGVYLGSDTVYYAGGDLEYDVRGYVYYNSNSTTSLNLYSLCQWIFNHGNYEVDNVEFYANDGAQTKNTSTWAYLSNPVTSGNNSRIETQWYPICVAKGYSDSVFSKNTSEHFAYTDMVAGNRYVLLGGWQSYWYQTSRDDDFHY